MTTLAAARAAIVTAVGASETYVDPPGCMVFSGGSDLIAPTLKGSVLWSWRVSCYVGEFKQNAESSKDLSAYVAVKLAALLALEGFSVDSVTPDTTRQIAGGDHLAADIAVSAYVTLS